jgi:hypothetical protein
LERRIERARRVLPHSDMLLTDIAATVRFDSLGYSHLAFAET